MPNSIELLSTLEDTKAKGAHSRRTARGWIAFWGSRCDALVRRRELFIVAGALGLLALFASLMALRFPFDVDEYLVQKTAQVGSPSAIWHLLRTAPLSVDPPLFHFLTHYSLRIFGQAEYVLRVPSVVAYVLMTFLLYRLIRKYADVYTGLTLIALCLLCGAFPYAYDARPYALWLAASSMALFCWASLVEERPHRRFALLGVFAGIAVAIGSHWFGFIMLAPIAVGELIRTWQRRQADAGFWAVFSAAAATGLAYLPLVKAAAEYKTLPWKGVALGDIPASFQLILEPCLVPLTLLLVIVLVAQFMDNLPTGLSQQMPSIPVPVFACLVTLALMPFPVFILGKLVTHAFQPRYALPCSIGLLVLVSLGIRDAVGRRPYLMASALLILSAYALVIQYHTIRALPIGGDPLAFADTSAFSAEPSLPIVPGVNVYFLRMEAHAPASLRERCVFPVDPDMVRVLNQNTSFLMAEGLRRWTNLPVIELSTFIRAHPRFYVIQLSCCPSWLIDRLLEDHAYMSLQGQYDGNPVYLVETRH